MIPLFALAVLALCLIGWIKGVRSCREWRREPNRLGEAWRDGLLDQERCS